MCVVVVVVVVELNHSQYTDYKNQTNVISVGDSKYI